MSEDKKDKRKVGNTFRTMAKKAHFTKTMEVGVLGTLMEVVHIMELMRGIMEVRHLVKM